MQVITSKDNGIVKKIRKLKEKKYRDFYNEFLVEGEHLVVEAYRSNLLEEILIEQDEVTILDVPITYVSKEILNKLSSLETPNTLLICSATKFLSFI